jgi:hypothetical protein
VDTLPLTPEARAPAPVEGVAVTLADGNAWTLTTETRELGGVWDELYDRNVLAGSYLPEDVLTAAYRLLRANYELTPAEAFGLLRDVEPASLVPIVEAALFGPARRHDTYSEWIEASLWAVGVDPSDVPPRLIRKVVEILEAQKTTVPHEQFVSSQQATALRRRMLNFGKE